jgi:hypothetical protein
LSCVFVLEAGRELEERRPRGPSRPGAYTGSLKLSKEVGQKILPPYPPRELMGVTSWGTFKEYSKSFLAFAFVDPGAHLKLARYAGRRRRYLYRLEELSIVIEPRLLLLCDLNWVEPPPPNQIRPATTACQDHHSTLISVEVGYRLSGSSGTTIQAMMYAISPAPKDSTKIKVISLTMIGSISKYSARPPQIPAITRFFLER